MGRKNRRNKREYRDRLGFNPNKYITHGQSVREDRNDRYERRSRTYLDERAFHHTEESRPYRTPYRGEVWFADLGIHPGTSVQEGRRPVLIVSNDKGNHHATTIVVLPMTSHMKKSDLPSHVELRQGDLKLVDPGRPFEESMILAEQITTIGKNALLNCIGRIEDADKLSEIGNAVKIQLAIQ